MSAEASELAEVYELPGSRTRFFPSVLATIKRGQCIWSRWPGGDSNMGSLFFHPDDAALIVAQGWIVIDGIRAKTSWDALEYGCRQTVRVEFEKPFRAHP